MFPKDSLRKVGRNMAGNRELLSYSSIHRMMLYFFLFLWLLKSLQHPSAEGGVPISLVRKIRLRNFKRLAQSYKTRFCLGFYPKNCSTHAFLTAPDSILSICQISVVQIRISEMVHTYHLCCSYTSCLGCLDRSSLTVMGRRTPPLPKHRAEMVQAICAAFSQRSF